MLKGMKRGIVTMLVASMLIGSTVSAAKDSPDKTNRTQTAKQLQTGAGTVNTDKKGTAAISKLKGSDKKTVSVPGEIAVGNVSYKVTKIKTNAFSENKDVEVIVLPKSLKRVEKKAFNGLSNLKTLRFTNTEGVKIANGTFKGVKTKKMTISITKNMPKKTYKKLVKRLRKAGFKGKIVRK